MSDAHNDLNETGVGEKLHYALDLASGQPITAIVSILVLLLTALEIFVTGRDAWGVLRENGPAFGRLVCVLTYMHYFMQIYAVDEVGAPLRPVREIVTDFGSWTGICLVIIQCVVFLASFVIDVNAAINFETAVSHIIRLSYFHTALIAYIQDFEGFPFGTDEFGKANNPTAGNLTASFVVRWMALMSLPLLDPNVLPTACCSIPVPDRIVSLYNIYFALCLLGVGKAAFRMYRIRTWFHAVVVISYCVAGIVGGGYVRLFVHAFLAAYVSLIPIYFMGPDKLKSNFRRMGGDYLLDVFNTFVGTYLLDKFERLVDFCYDHGRRLFDAFFVCYGAYQIYLGARLFKSDEPEEPWAMVLASATLGIGLLLLPAYVGTRFMFEQAWRRLEIPSMELNENKVKCFGLGVVSPVLMYYWWLFFIIVGVGVLLYRLVSMCFDLDGVVACARQRFTSIIACARDLDAEKLSLWLREEPSQPAGWLGWSELRALNIGGFVSYAALVVPPIVVAAFFVLCLHAFLDVYIHIQEARMPAEEYERRIGALHVDSQRMRALHEAVHNTVFFKILFRGLQINGMWLSPYGVVYVLMQFKLFSAGDRLVPPAWYYWYQ